ncbi:MAG: EVE domain-containing protein [Flavobacteriales bacterium]|nr:EVE domain-containing protein [Flavobacteriales bacterium]MCX7651208.1 EVE domain-containing protein [Flavobacteriales bacterium]MDW8432465.1 EVE domain-containing protein [Flavobacteriales bacterium]
MYYLIKSDPETYGWEDLNRDKRTRWDGIRNYQARNYLKIWQPGDQLLFYHSGEEKALVGVAEVISDPYPEPGTNDTWWCADIIPLKKFKRSVPLALIKQDPALQNLPLLRQSRLSVMPVSEMEFKRLCQLGEGRL